MNGRQPAGARMALRRASGEPFPLAAGREDLALRVRRPDERRGRLHERAVTALAQAQHLVAGALRADVEGDAVGALERAAFIEFRLAAHAQPAARAARYVDR